LIDWSQKRLAEASGVGFATIQRSERAQSGTGLVSTIQKIRSALEAAGVEFIDDGPEGGPGVRLKK
jgi:transcriptional regulator with XRE-family HTH domain